MGSPELGVQALLCSIKAGAETQGTEGLVKHMASLRRLENSLCVPEIFMGKQEPGDTGVGC